jgi:cellulose synthase/poly-beta-1,6-N-acetylglucosamine synthase-like glycosyltransferase
VHAPYCVFMWPVRLYHIFPHSLINGTIFGKKKLLAIKCVFWFALQHLPQTFLILRRTWWDIIINVHRSSCKVPVIFVPTWIFSTDFRKTLKCHISWKSVQWEPSCCMRTDRWTHMTKLIMTFRNFANVPRNVTISGNALKWREWTPSHRKLISGEPCVACRHAKRSEWRVDGKF